MFNLKFLGRGAAFYPAFGNTNAFFETNGDLFFLDFGESAYEKVVRLLDLTAYRHIYVLLTHLHADHSGSLASLLSYTHCVLHREVTVVHPLDTVMQLLTIQGISPEFYHYLSALPESCAVSAQPFDVPHAENMRAFGYLLSDANESIYYSGDAAQLPEEIARRFLSGEIARIYHDTASHESASHCYYQRLVDAIPREKRHAVYAMHLDGDYVDMLKGLGFSVVETI